MYLNSGSFHWLLATVAYIYMYIQYLPLMKLFKKQANFVLPNQISLFLTQLQLQPNELKLNTQNAQSREKKFKVSHQINPVAEAYRETAKGP